MDAPGRYFHGATAGVARPTPRVVWLRSALAPSAQGGTRNTRSGAHTGIVTGGDEAGTGVSRAAAKAPAARAVAQEVATARSPRAGQSEEAPGGPSGGGGEASVAAARAVALGVATTLSPRTDANVRPVEGMTSNAQTGKEGDAVMADKGVAVEVAERQGGDEQGENGMEGN